jgi:hypothetical protein
MRITTWQGAGAALLALATLTLGGCTAGEVVDALRRQLALVAHASTTPVATVRRRTALVLPARRTPLAAHSPLTEGKRCRDLQE